MVYPILMYGCKNLKKTESWRIVVLEKTLENPLDCKEIKPVNPKGCQPWILIGRTDAESKAPIFWPPDGNSQLTGKNSDAGKDWGRKEASWGLALGQRKKSVSSSESASSLRPNGLRDTACGSLSAPQYWEEQPGCPPRSPLGKPNPLHGELLLREKHS